MNKPWFAPKYNKLTFAEVWPSQKAFLDDYSAIGGYLVLPNANFSENALKTLYFMLYAKYGNNPIINDDVNQWKFKVFSIIYAYGPAWERKVQIQKTVQALTETELMTGAKQVYNHALNPSTVPSTTTLEELQYINDQNVASHKKSKLEAYTILWELIHTNHTEEFLGRFRDCFSKFVGVIPVPFYIDDVNVIPEEEEEEP